MSLPVIFVSLIFIDLLDLVVHDLFFALCLDYELLELHKELELAVLDLNFRQFEHVVAQQSLTLSLVISQEHLLEVIHESPGVADMRSSVNYQVFVFIDWSPHQGLHVIVLIKKRVLRAVEVVFHNIKFLGSVGD